MKNRNSPCFLFVPMNLLEFPEELLCAIGMFVSCKGLVVLSRTCHQLHSFFSSSYIYERIVAIAPKQKHLVHNSGRYITFVPGILLRRVGSPYPMDGVYFYDSDYSGGSPEISFFFKRFGKLLPSKSGKSGKFTPKSAKRHVMTYLDKRTNVKFHRHDIGVIVNHKGKWGNYNDIDVDIRWLFDSGAAEIQTFWEKLLFGKMITPM